MATSNDEAREQAIETAAERRRARIAPIRRVLLFIALALGVLVDGFFALVNFYPVAPRRDRGPRHYVVAVMDEDQAQWFQANMLDEFNDANGTNLQLRIADDESLEASIAAPDVALAVLPLSVAQQTADHSHVLPFDAIATPAQINADFGAVRPELLGADRLRGAQYFLPRSVALDVAVYRVSRVRDAMLHWHLVQPEIDAALRVVNGRGLPTGYTLEEEPTSWDSFDQFVMAFYWAHRSYAGQPARGRIAHRTGADEDGQMDIVAEVYRAGATDATIGTRDSVAAADWFQWQALYHQLGLFAPEMNSSAGVDDDGIRAGVADGRLFLTSVDQREAWVLHGGGHRGARPQVPDEDDVGFVAMPRFSSLELDARGRPTRTDASFSFREQNVWVLPSTSVDARTGYRFAAWVMSAENHARECEATGALPIRVDTVRERVTRFRSPWMLAIFEAGLAQWPRSQRVPDSLGDGLGLDYALTWDAVVRRGTVAPQDRAGLLAALRAPVDRTAAYATPTDAPAPSGDDAGTDAIHAFAVPPLREPLVFQWHSSDDAGGVDAEVRR